MWYYMYEKLTGRLVSESEKALDLTGKEEVYSVKSYETRPTQENKIWNPVKLDFDPIVIVKPQAQIDAEEALVVKPDPADTQKTLEWLVKMVTFLADRELSNG